MFTTTQEVSAESAELRLLPISRCVLAYPALLTGYRTVEQALEDDCLNAYVRTFLTSARKSLGDTDFPTNAGTFINALMDDLLPSGGTCLLSEWCRDGASALSEGMLPYLLDRLKQGKAVSSLAFLLAVYGQYLQAGVDDQGQAYDIDEPTLTPHDRAMLVTGDVLAVLDLSVFAWAQLRSFPQLVARYKTYRNQLACYGLAFSLRQMLCTFREEETDGYVSV